MRIRRPTRGWVLLVGGVIVATVAALLAVSVWMPTRRVTNRAMVQLERRELVVAWTSGPIDGQFLAGYVYGMKISGKGSPAWRPSSLHGKAGFRGSGLVGFTIVTVPMPATLAVVVLLTGVAWLLARMWVPPGHCATCGYDLAGLRDGTCPECGGAVAKLLRWLVARRFA